MEGRMDKQTEGSIYGYADRQTERWMNGRMDIGTEKIHLL